MQREGVAFVAQMITAPVERGCTLRIMKQCAKLWMD